MLYLDDMTALAFWRLASIGWLEQPSPCDARAPEDSCVSAEHLRQARALLGSASKDELRVLVGSQSTLSRREGALVSVLEASRPLPAGSFFEVGGQLRVVSPELCFVRLARHMNETELALVGMELCGMYRANPMTHRVEYGCTPLCTVQSLCSMIEDLPKTAGRKRARVVARRLADGAASPQESVLYLLATTSTRLGGYGLPKPLLNPPATLDETAQLIAGQGEARCDLYWVKQRVIVEYDSDEFHVRTRASDAERRDGLESMGNRVMTITTAQLKSFARLDACMTTLARYLGRRRQPSDKAIRDRRLTLYLDLKAASRDRT